MRTPLACHLSLCMCAALCSCKISAKGGRWVAVLVCCAAKVGCFAVLQRWVAVLCCQWLLCYALLFFAVLCCRLEGSGRELITSCLLPPLLHQLPINRARPDLPQTTLAEFCPSLAPLTFCPCMGRVHGFEVSEIDFGLFQQVFREFKPIPSHLHFNSFTFKCEFMLDHNMNQHM